MQIQPITVNGKTLTDSEAITLHMMLAIVTMDLEELDPKRNLEGLPVSEHLKNIRRLRMLTDET